MQCLNELLFVVAFVLLVPDKYSYKSRVATIVFVSYYIQTQKYICRQFPAGTTCTAVLK